MVRVGGCLWAIEMTHIVLRTFGMKTTVITARLVNRGGSTIVRIQCGPPEDLPG